MRGIIPLGCVALAMANPRQLPATREATQARLSEARARTVAPGPVPTASARVLDAAGWEIGTLTLTDTVNGISVSGTLRGLPPGTHAIHLHAVGKCERPRFESASGHWNPTNREHGTRNPRGPHLGDLPNFVTGSDGVGTVRGVTPGGTLRGATPLLDADGAAIVVHGRADDYRTDPGPFFKSTRLACGVVTSS